MILKFVRKQKKYKRPEWFVNIQPKILQGMNFK